MVNRNSLTFRILAQRIPVCLGVQKMEQLKCKGVAPVIFDFLKPNPKDWKELRAGTLCLHCI